MCILHTTTYPSRRSLRVLPQPPSLRKRRIIISRWNTKTNNINFSFTPFAPGNASARAPDEGATYFWGLGTIKGQDNVLTLNVRRVSFSSSLPACSFLNPSAVPAGGCQPLAR